VAFGDSITHGYGGTISYPQYLAGLMPGTTIINKGVNGDTTGKMLGRIKTDVINNHPQYVIVLGGVNDINLYLQPGTISGILQSIYRQALQNDITPVLCTVMPDSSYPTAKKNSIVALNALITSYATSNNLPLVDLYTAMQDPSVPGNLNPLYDSGDGLHPNNAGYQHMAETIYNTVFAP
jgi:acyl-CoA thioesterase I